MNIGASPVPTSPVSHSGRSLVPASQLDMSHHHVGFTLTRKRERESVCSRAHPLKILNVLDPAATEELVYVYSNSKMVAATRDADELRMFSWHNEAI